MLHAIKVTGSKKIKKQTNKQKRKKKANRIKVHILCIFSLIIPGDKKSNRIDFHILCIMSLIIPGDEKCTRIISRRSNKFSPTKAFYRKTSIFHLHVTYVLFWIAKNTIYKSTSIQIEIWNMIILIHKNIFKGQVYNC